MTTQWHRRERIVLLLALVTFFGLLSWALLVILFKRSPALHVICSLIVFISVVSGIGLVGLTLRNRGRADGVAWDWGSTTVHPDKLRDVIMRLATEQKGSIVGDSDSTRIIIESVRFLRKQRTIITLRPTETGTNVSATFFGTGLFSATFMENAASASLLQRLERMKFKGQYDSAIALLTQSHQAVPNSTTNQNGKDIIQS